MPKPRRRAASPGKDQVPDDHQTTFGRNVRELRFAQGRTQSDLAAAAKLSAQYIGQIEEGRINVTISSMRRIAAALAVELVILLQPSATPGCEKPVITPE